MLKYPRNDFVEVSNARQLLANNPACQVKAFYSPTDFRVALNIQSQMERLLVNFSSKTLKFPTKLSPLYYALNRVIGNVKLNGANFAESFKTCLVHAFTLPNSGNHSPINCSTRFVH